MAPITTSDNSSTVRRHFFPGVQGRLRREPLAVKVPEITAWFWILKLLTTATGEAASDYQLSTVGLVAVAIGMLGFGFTLRLQFRTRRYNAFAYWAAVMMVAIFGTMAADIVHRELGLSFAACTLFCALAVAVIFWSWHRTEGTLSVHSITTRRREVFYWLRCRSHSHSEPRRATLPRVSCTSDSSGRLSFSPWSWAFRRWGTGAFTSTVSSPSGGRTS